MSKVINEILKTKIRDSIDVVVCGGGAAGITAALAAARMGMKIILIESYGFLGGVNTAAGVNGLGGWQFDLNGKPLIGGIPMEIMEEHAKDTGQGMEMIRYLTTPVKKPDYTSGGLGCFWFRTNPEYMKITLDKMIEKAKVKVIYHASAVAPIMNNNTIKGVFIESKSGREAILAKIVIDCTGDGDIAARAGAAFDMGRPGDGICQPMTMIFTVGSADIRNLFLGNSKNSTLTKDRYKGAVRLARKRKEIILNPNDIFCAATELDEKNPAVRSVNFTRIQKVDATNVDELTKAEITGRKQVVEAIRFMNKYMFDGKDAYLISIPPQIGIRESRRIKGEYTLTEKDIKGGARFKDAIARGIYLIDTHNRTEIGKASDLILLKQPYDIPYRCLVPLEIENILVAGRCISGDSTALSSYRIISHCMAMGEAAGTAAALAIRRNKRIRNVDTCELQQQLIKNGANVGPL